MSISDTEIARLRALPYAERHPRITFRGEPHFTPCGPCSDLQLGTNRFCLGDATVAVHPCWASNGACVCGCDEVVVSLGTAEMPEAAA